MVVQQERKKKNVLLDLLYKIPGIVINHQRNSSEQEMKYVCVTLERFQIKDNFVPIPLSATFTLSADVFIGTTKKAIFQNSNNYHLRVISVA